MTSLARSGSDTPSCNLADDEDDGGDVIVKSARPGFLQATESPVEIPETNQTTNSIADVQSLQSDPKIKPGGSLRPPKRNQAQSPPESDRRKFKRLRFEGDVFELPVSPEPDRHLQPSFSTTTTVVNSELGSPSLEVPV